MAAANWYPNGAGGTVGDPLTTLPNLYTPGTIWYVGNAGTDAAAPAGKRREKPLKTTAQAVTNSAAGDMIVWLSGFTETISVSVVINKSGLILASEGTTSGTRARLTCAGVISMLDITATNVVVANAYFPASTAAAVARVRTAAADTNVLNCYFECGVNDGSGTFSLITGASAVYLEDSSFVSVGGSPASQPGSAFVIVNAVTGIVMNNVIFDGGASGWSNSAFLGSSAITNLRATNIDLLNDSVVAFASGTTGKFWLRNKSGNSEVIWTP